MSWVEGHIQDKKLIDVNEELSQLKGDLSEATARKTLGRFLMYNLGILVFWLTGMKLYPDQRILIKGWLFKNFTLTIAGRGFGKTWTLSHFCYIYCLFNPGKTIVMIAPTFRSSRRVIQHIEKWARAKRGFMLKQCVQLTKQGEIVSKQADLWELTFKNGSKIIALPLGVDGEKVRGYRCSVLCIDEGLLIPQSTIDKVLKPFIITPSEEETTRRQNVREREAYLIKKGLMKEEDRTKFSSDVKMIIISSASYTWEDLYSLYTKYLKIIYSQDDKMMKRLDEKEREALGKDEEAKAEVIKGDDIPSSYLVQQLSYKAQPPDRIDAAVREEIESGMFSEAVIKREYEAQFVQDSDGYFRARVMEDCTLKGENDPTIEIVGEKGAEYVVAIDPNLGGSETNDHFAMCVIKIIEKKFSDGMRKCGLVVHQYANAGAKPEHHIGYFLYILQNFNVVYVAVDTSQGANMDFINFCNESAQFKTAKRNLQPIQYADFGKENFEDLVREIQNGYNLSAGQIVQKQYFHSTFQKAANEYMQTCFNRRTLLFAAKGIPNESAMTKMRNQSEVVSDILTSHPDFAEEGVPGDIDDFIGQQDVLIDLVKKECALIEVKVSSLGNVTFDLPAHMKKQSKSRSRLRRDSYSALFLGNWAVKLYLESKENPTEQFGEFYAGWALPR